MDFNGTEKLRNKSTIDGYIRNVEKESFHDDEFHKRIPEIINDLCIEYYHIPKDRFDPDLHEWAIEVRDNEAEYIFDGEGASSAFLSNTASQGIHKWRFRTTGGNMDDWGATFIGIIDTTEDLNDKYSIHFPRVIKKSYGLNWRHGNARAGGDGGDEKKIMKRKYCKRIGRGDTLEMCLDLNALELKYTVNDKDCGKAFNIPAATYRAGISMTSLGDRLKLLQYDYQQNV